MKWTKAALGPSATRYQASGKITSYEMGEIRCSLLVRHPLIDVVLVPLGSCSTHRDGCLAMMHCDALQPSPLLCIRSLRTIISIEAPVI
jgi:hypothetical protein